MNGASESKSELIQLVSIFIVASVFLFGLGFLKLAVPSFISIFTDLFALIAAVRAASSLSKMLINIPTSEILRRHGRRIILIIGLLVHGIGIFLLTFATNILYIAFCGIISGLGLGIYATSITTIIGDATTKEIRGKAFGIYSTLSFSGSVVGPIIGGLLGYLGLRYLIAMGAGMSMLAVLISIPLLQESKRIEDSKKPRISRTAYSSLLQRADLDTIYFVSFYEPAFVSGVVLTILPVFAYKELGLTEAGFMLSAFFFADMLLGFPAGVISDKFGGRINLVVGTVIAGLASIGLVYTTSFEMLLLNIALFGAGVGFFCPILPALVINMTSAGEKERAIGLLRTIQDLGFMIGPIVFGLAADLLGVRWAMSIGTAPYFIATLLALKKLKLSI